MANANPGELMDSASDGSDDEGSGLGKSSANGSVVANVDRYGFMGGKQYTNPDNEDVHRLPPEILRKREIKWLDMFENWEKWMSKRFKKKYLQLPGDPKSLDEITKDLHRQFPLHEMFSKQGGYGQEDLFLVLKAYTVYNPAEGYCQAHAPIAAVLLMHMPAEQAFWCLVAICEKYLPGYYSPGLEAIQLDGDVLFGLLKKTSPAVYKHLKKQRVEPIMYMTEWFMCVFTRNLPWACVLRIWDMFLCEGVKVMFRIALVLIKMTLSGGDKLAECTSFYETLEKLRNIPMDAFDEETLARESLKLNINERDMEKEHQRQIVKRRKEKEKGSRSNKKNKT
ncbi:TBC1 domain family member 10B-like isoform X2 [Haliotis rufescens]|uniref:TBC1 domain family member 10B-like isoform X2 n=1 Tax=Haliotis rufescens TaxID=6454 RepID=UPI001EB04D7F|nr:TBC1 domain family member 10B-like isoform X2 [Haliotis rufescens]